MIRRIIFEQYVLYLQNAVAVGKAERYEKAGDTFEKIVPETHGLFAKSVTLLFLKHVDIFQMIPDET